MWISRGVRFQIINSVRLHPFQLISSKSLIGTIHFHFLHGNLATKACISTKHRIKSQSRARDTEKEPKKERKTEWTRTEKKKCSKTLRFICWKSAYTINWHTNVTRFYVIRRSIPFVLIFITKINWNCKDVANRVKYFCFMMMMMMNVKNWWPNVDYKIKETLNRFVETKQYMFRGIQLCCGGVCHVTTV